MFLSWLKCLPQTTKCSFNWSSNWTVVWFTKRRPSAVPRAHVDTSTCLVLSIPTVQNLNKSSLRSYKMRKSWKYSPFMSWSQWNFVQKCLKISFFFFFFKVRSSDDAQSYNLCSEVTHFWSDVFPLLCHLWVVCFLQRVPRTGWVYRNVKKPESVSDHMYRMAMMSLTITDPTVDKDRYVTTQKATFQHLKRKYSSEFSPSVGLQKWLQPTLTLKYTLYHTHILCLPSLSLDV